MEISSTRGELTARLASLKAARQALSEAISALELAIAGKPPVKRPRLEPRIIITGAPTDLREPPPSPAPHIEAKAAREQHRRRVVRRLDRHAQEHTLHLIAERGDRGVSDLHVARVFKITLAAAQHRLRRLMETGLIVRDLRGIYRGVAAVKAPEVRNAQAA